MIIKNQLTLFWFIYLTIPFLSISIFRSSFFISEESCPSSIFVTRCWIFHRIRNLAKISSYVKPLCSDITFLSLRTALTLSFTDGCKDRELTNGSERQKLEDLEVVPVGRIFQCFCMRICAFPRSTWLPLRGWWMLLPLRWYLWWRGAGECLRGLARWVCEGWAFECKSCPLWERWRCWLQIQRRVSGGDEECCHSHWSGQPHWRLRRWGNRRNTSSGIRSSLRK